MKINKDNFTVLSLFDGGSGGQLAFKDLGIEFDGVKYKYFASEIKNHAIKLTKHHFPNTIHIGDVTKVSYKDGILYTENGKYEVGEIDVLIGGSPCFVAGTKVITINGYKNIEDIVVGDEVLTHKNRFKKVLSIGGDFKDIYSLKAQGLLETHTTENHPYYVRGKVNCSLSNPMWKEVKNIDKNDYIGIPINTNDNNTHNLSKEDCWLLGRYVADGHCRKDKRKNRKDSYQYQVVYSIGSHKLDVFKENVKRKFSCYPHSQSVHRCVINSMDMVNFIIDNNFGRKAIEKRIPQFILDLPVDLATSFLDGYMAGDGCFTNDKFKASTTSKELAMGLCLLVAKCYRIHSNIYEIQVEKQKTIEGRTVNQNTHYQIVFDKNNIDTNVRIIDDIIWMPVRDVKILKHKQSVFNIEVEDDNSYTANNAIVHNCQDFSMLNYAQQEQYRKEKLGLEGTKSSLFYEYLRIKKEINPTYFFLENVKMKKESELQLNEFLNCNGIHACSSLVSYQTRSRIYWSNAKLEKPNNLNINFQDFKDMDYEYCKQFKVKRTPSRERMWNNGEKGLLGTCKNITDSQTVGCVTRKQDRAPNSGLIQFEDFCRYLTRRELELAQTMPVGYTDILSYNQAQDIIGDGWTIKMISHFFKQIIEQINENVHFTTVENTGFEN